MAAAFPAEAQPIENVRVTDASGGFAFQARPSIVIDGQGRIFAGWAEMNDIWGFNRVAFGRSLDGGRTWERSLVEVAAPGQLQSNPRLALAVLLLRSTGACHRRVEAAPAPRYQ